MLRPQMESSSHRESSCLREQIIGLAQGRFGIVVLGAVSFVESIFFPVTPLMLLIPLCALNRRRWFAYAMTVVICGELGCCVTYLLGYFLWESFIYDVVVQYGLSGDLNTITQLYADYGGILPFVGAFLPITYNVVAVFCGMISANAELMVRDFGNMNFAFFVIFSSAGKFIRFTVETWLLAKAVDGTKRLAKLN